MVDSKIVASQVKELQVILHEIHAEEMVLSETFKVAAIVEKLSPCLERFQELSRAKKKENEHQISHCQTSH